MTHFDAKRAHITVPRLRMGKCAGYIVCAIDGDMVRTNIDDDFAIGGNPGRYRYVPLNEVWIERSIFSSPHDLMANLIHEIIECHKMRLQGMSYDDAHDEADEWEERFRKEREPESINDAYVIVEEAYDEFLSAA